jgi:hypothetical protein
MQNLKFKQLLVLSNSSNSANQFIFSETLNLITAVDNSVGKTTLVKLLFWGLGCEPDFDVNWTSMDCKTIVEFQIDENIFAVKRHKNQISLKENNSPYTDFTKITGEYSVKMAEIMSFKALLPNRSTGILETPPPAFYFLPYYIDQKRSWATAWNNFESLEQYANWKSTIIKYHVGLLIPTYFDLESDKVEKKEIKKNIEVQIDKINTALEVVENYIPTYIKTTINNEKLESFTKEIKVDLKNLQQTQEYLLDELAQLNGDQVYLEQQKLITEKIIFELNNDYKFTIENVQEDEIECPLCGVIHENSIVNRASIITDKTQAENQLEAIDKELAKLRKKTIKNDDSLDIVKSNISEINNKYIIEEEGEKIDFNHIIETIAGNTIKENVITDKTNKIGNVVDLVSSIKLITKNQKNLLTTEDIQEINDSFNLTFGRFIKLLDAEAVNLSEINSPLDYKKVIKAGGAAEGARAILAYYLTIYTLVEKFGNEVISPLVIDTPNQQEQSDSNYEKIVNILTTKISKKSQIILCAMNNEHLKSFEKTATIITLDSNKILDKTKYKEVKKYFQ